MWLRRNVVAVSVAALALGACGASDDAGVTVDEIVAAPEPALETSPSVAKSGRVEMEVARDQVSGAAQAVVDLATSPKVGGFLTSSVVDLRDGYGAAAILVHVPAERFEQTIAELGDVGEVTLQEMAGQAVTETADGSRERTDAEPRATFAPIDVAIAGRRPAPPPEKGPIERALATAKGMSLAIASGGILAAGALLPAAAILLLVYLAWALLIRRLRFRWDQSSG